MRSVAELKKKLVLATAQGKDHRRSAMIRAMRTRLREQVGRPFEWVSNRSIDYAYFEPIALVGYVHYVYSRQIPGNCQTNKYA